ncbi:F-box DNA helicase 1 isoform X2 [Sphaeramia orbicularis]|uniref:F-box DNA helicase 1 isoform X2 n=1 Tax=Sphaeramia orbicularis TaxID=375764 RepID=UPI0011808068|nr:F-box DNA helicase 1 isoform X2 [Sphaeramia orbicularis]
MASKMEVAVKGKAKRRHLNAEECDELGRHPDGTGALTQPHTVNSRQRNRDPNRGLYPKTPTKRQKCASASGSPAGGQKAINDFFSVTKVISSSPNKSSQPCSSTHMNGVRGELFPKADPERENDDDEEDDDASLLAAVLVTESKAKEEMEVTDDTSLLPTQSVLETKEMVEEMDYLEGITSEMFDDDDDFLQCSNAKGPQEHIDEEEVEALLDAHYGLLGSGRDLLQPQGCIDDLPEEVLRHVLCFVPAQDLYRNVSLVCHRWRNIVEDTKFVPNKKRYYRYTVREKNTMADIFSILKSNGINDRASNQNSIRNLVTLMAHYKVGERVRPEDVLECVKKHRLFPQAEASIRLRIPNIQKSINLGIEGPNPYAAMAVILILNETVDDVQSLVSLLTVCMSYTAITEYLCYMATMLLALKRSNIRISNRVHYNIYYVLHLMENGPFSVTVDQSRQPQIQLTHEQQQILSHDIHKDHVVKIMAFAGTGKTTTLVKYAEQRPDLRFLYVAFNKSVATEATRRFPRNVACKTVHSLAFKDVGIRYHIGKKLTSNLNAFVINSVLPKGRGGFLKSKIVLTTLNTFMASVDPAITTSHVPSTYRTNRNTKGYIDSDEKVLFARDTEVIWTKMKDLREKRHEAHYMTHDGYLKLWQLQKPCLSNQYDAIFIDEAQDCTPVVLDILLSQRCGKILVGDPHQQIYTFKGAVNALQDVDHTHIFYLTQSFRFGAEIAYVGAAILKVCKKVQKILVGGRQKGGVSDDTAVRVAEAVRTGVSLCRGKTAILSRCNFTVFTEAVRLTDINPQCRIHFVGGVRGIGLDKINDIWKLMQKAQPGAQGANEQAICIRDPLIRSFAKKMGFWGLKAYATQTEDRELEGKLSIVEKYRHRIPALVERFTMCSEEDFLKADFILGTVHKAKGMEFDTVMVTDDFVKVPSSWHNVHHFPDFSFAQDPEDEWNLLYVAVTRARTSLIITRNIHRILTFDGDYFLKSEMPSSLLKSNDPLPCRVGNCPNCITPGSSFIMCKRRMEYTDGASSEGPLCERCVWTRIGPTAFLMTDDVLSMAEIPEMFNPPGPHIMLLALF